MKTIRDALLDATRRLERADLSYGHGTSNAFDEAAWLVLHAAGIPPFDLNAHLHDPLSAEQERAARELVTTRIRARKPAAYVLNEAWLGRHKFYVDERVIVPRSFIGELLMQNRKNGARLTFSGGKSQPGTVLDLCTGSGCLAILAALRFPGAEVDAADLSDDALAVARKNVADYKLARRVQLLKSDLFAALEGRKYDLIVSNPPYVTEASMRKLPDEYRREPAMALAGGRDGLEHTRRIIAGARRHLEPKGRLVVEIGHNRKALEKSFPELPFEWPKVAAGRGYVFALGRDSLP